MSYSFNVKGANKAEAKAAVAAKFDEMMVTQPIHARDREAALSNAGAMIDLLADDDSKDVSVIFNGALSWPTTVAEGEAPNINSASAGCSAQLVPRVEAAHHPV